MLHILSSISTLLYILCMHIHAAYENIDILHVSHQKGVKTNVKMKWDMRMVL